MISEHSMYTSRLFASSSDLDRNGEWGVPIRLPQSSLRDRIHLGVAMKNQLLIQLTLTLTLAALFSTNGQAQEKPNIVVILADDFGVGDIQAHYPDNKIKSPFLDQLVREGISFKDAHSPSAVCSPTRLWIVNGAIQLAYTNAGVGHRGV